MSSAANYRWRFMVERRHIKEKKKTKSMMKVLLILNLNELTLLLCYNGFFLLVAYNKLGMVHCTRVSQK